MLAVVAGLPASALADDMVRVLAAGAVQGAVLRLQSDPATAGAAKIDLMFDTVGALRDRVLRGEKADVAILSQAGIAALEKAGKVDGQAVDLGRVSVALAVRNGAPKPDVASANALKRALLSATSIAHADPARGATAGTHFARVLDQLGIAQQIQSRITVLPFGGDVIEGVAQGRFEIGVSQSSEIVAHQGVLLAGRLPAPYDHHTRYLAVKLGGAGARAEPALAFLQTAAARAVFIEFGFDVGQ